jgi:uncharacterized membrane protein YeaQ/YmgE (transglycosylase-associated protein family)
MKKKIAGWLKYMFINEKGKFSTGKIMAWLAGLCGSVVAFQGVLMANGVTITPELIPYFKVATIITALIAIIRTKHSAEASVKVQPTPEEIKQ